MANQDRNPQNGVQGSSYLYDYGTSPNTRTVSSQKIRILAPTYGQKNLVQLGVVQSFSPSQSRSVETIRGIGFGDKIAELVPSVMDAIAGDVSRTMLYLCNLWQSFGYAAGVDGPVRSLAHHRWPFDMEVQIVFSTLADNDLGVANEGLTGTAGTFKGGISAIKFGEVTNSDSQAIAPGSPGDKRGHSAIIVMYEGCWFTSYSGNYDLGSAMITESGGVTASDVHDFSTTYGEFLATGNDPTIGQFGSTRFQ